MLADVDVLHLRFKSLTLFVHNVKRFTNLACMGAAIFNFRNFVFSRTKRDLTNFHILSAAVMAEENLTSALFRRHEQLKRWHESDTNKCSDVPVGKPKRVKFQDGCVFLAACSSGDREEVKRLLDRGADINTANIDGLTALHQVYFGTDQVFGHLDQRHMNETIIRDSFRVFQQLL